MKKYEEIYKKVNEIIEPVYLVGGSVRDILLGIEPKDYDFSTPILPDEIEKQIRTSGRRAYLVGKKFGTIGCKIEGEFVEITTFRQEFYSKNNRKPQVDFVQNIENDLKRRDFTINAIAWQNGKFIDLFAGKEDLENKIIRSVGNPKKRIEEDPLRMLRCARFMSQLNFSVESDLERKIKNNSFRILFVSQERWVMELDKILLSKNPEIGLNFIMKNRLFNFMIPELSLQYKYDQNSPYHDFDLWTHTLKTVAATPPDINLRWAALLHDIAKPFVRTNKIDRSNYIYHAFLGANIVDKIGYHLKWSKTRKKTVVDIVKNHLKIDSPLKEYDNISKKNI
jgi:tRNA nucleotidyltransferase (CCA-adding enzyme)